jgi:hypothetical protein
VFADQDTRVFVDPFLRIFRAKGPRRFTHVFAP